MKALSVIAVFLPLLLPFAAAFAQDPGNADPAPLWCEYEGGEGPGKGKQIVLIAGDDEYRSEEVMPMLGQILARRHGFHCTVLFPINPETGLIQPDYQTNIPGMEAVADADLVILGLRFRNLPDDAMKYFADYVDSGRPIIGLRTSTHAFRIPKDVESAYPEYSFDDRTWVGGFGQQVLGDTWISHHGNHGRESTRGIVNPLHADHPILQGVNDVWGPTDVYGIRNLPDTAEVLLYGQILSGMKPDSVPVFDRRNKPMMPLAWIKGFESKSGRTSRIFNTTMGSSTDFECEDLRRLLVNAAYWAVELESEIPEAADVEFVSPYEPTPFGFGNYRKGLRPADYQLGD